MNIRLISDLHLEFYTAPLKLWRQLVQGWNLGDDLITNEILVLAGDIGYPLNHDGDGNANFRELLALFRKHWQHIILVSGNHEYYCNKGVTTTHSIDKEIKRVCDELGIHFLQKESVIIEGTRFLGCTLWTAITFEAFMSMNDCRIFNGEVEEYQNLHKDHLQWLQGEVAKETIPTIVVTHHLPSHQMIHPRFKDMKSLIPGFATDLDEFITQNPHIKMWCCGHTHERNQTTINSTKVVCNPYGYPGEKRVTKVNWTVENDGIDIGIDSEVSIEDS